MAFRHGFKTQANRAVVEIRAALGLEATAPLSPWLVCDYYDVKVLKLSEMLNENGSQVGHHFLHVAPGLFSAVVFARGIHTAIVHNDSHALVRQRSNLFHELAHLFLGHPIRPLLSTDGTRNRNSMVEQEAEFMGGCLMIPNEAACHIVNTGMQARAAEIYGVSEVMLTYRLGVSGAMRIAARRTSKRTAS